MKSKLLIALLLLFVAIEPGHAMHIMEGYMPLGWCAFWYAVSIPFVVLSYRYIHTLIKGEPKERIVFALNTAFVFILSALKLPSVTGSSSHLTGTTLGTLTTGIMAMPLVGFIVLLFQSLLLAHGGISTLGANIFSLAIAGPFVAYLIYNGFLKLGLGRSVAIFLAATLGSLATYITTSIQLAVVFPDPHAGIWASFVKFVSIFAITQIPLSILEGVMTLTIMRLLTSTRGEIELKTISRSKTIILSSLAFICLALPLVGGILDFGVGTDDRAGEMIEALNPHHDTSSLISTFEPTEGAEPWFFALQVLIGLGLFTWGLWTFKKSNKH